MTEQGEESGKVIINFVSKIIIIKTTSNIE